MADKFDGPAIAAKNLVVCLDGTWVNADRGGNLTNIGKIARLVDPQPPSGRTHRVYYDAGVGTGGLFDSIEGGALGVGLSTKVLEAYRFLSQFYRPGDDIFVFGFSRGAFTARSLCGFISASGLLRGPDCTKENQDFAWNYYRTPPKARYPSDKAKLDGLTHQDLRVRFLGVFDTVGALGIPRRRLNFIGRFHFEFHDTDVSGVVDHSCHAIAIDEKRSEFEANVWSEPRHRNFKTVEQVWFPGVHSDIGGGYDDTGISNLTLDWMLGRAQKYAPTFVLQEPPLAGNGLGPISESRTWLYWRSRLNPLIRLIDRADKGIGPPNIKSAPPPNSRPIGETLHWSAVARWEATRNRSKGEAYSPLNLIAAMEKHGQQDLRVVSPSGDADLWQEVKKLATVKELLHSGP